MIRVSVSTVGNGKRKSYGQEPETGARGGRKRQEVGGAANDFRFASIQVPKEDIFEKNDFSWDVKNVE